jgi:hypothetical protein
MGSFSDMRDDQLARQWPIIQAIEASPNGPTVAEPGKEEETGISIFSRKVEALHSHASPLYTERVGGANRWALIDTFKFKLLPGHAKPPIFILCALHLCVRVKRNRDRFPENFMFQLTAAEKTEVVAKCDHLAKLKYSPTHPYAFTEHGAIMLAAVLNTPRAIEVSVYVVRAFVRLREILTTHKALAHKLAELENKIESHDEAIRSLVSGIRQLMAYPERPPKKIGFQLREKRAAYSARG